ncbi:Uncharacterized protein, contains SIS (Sugar ISomerase) phosphosugar binding domain [Pedobacter westerhofensis]|uniref:Uncharacterized protein, contains SIS (Sugar ISomerase) phosphosugar binding domain n=1 Tax=Pedobacter westerhofensis TaxID=425512 RepID=A0A521BAI9_9SPHI|nr:sugar isomerase domain-containing protein [Pedobacter westerhofensis]SMO44089.1 Uncharacterized protein, contains SIS (Sugar ISomerase) phosphosugar binding domain [Pedobacter westerhofensis]
MFEYFEKVTQLINTIAAAETKNIEKAAEWVSEVIIADQIIHAFGSGHSHIIGMELFTRAGGLANVNTILDDLVLATSGARRGAAIERVSGLADILWDKYKISSSDIMIIISNGGRNAMPIEMAMRAKKEGLKVIAITSLTQSQSYPSRHASGKRLCDVADLVIDNHVPSGDGLMEAQGKLVGPASSIAGMLLVNTITTEAMKIASAKGAKLPIYHSQNIDGYSNEELYQKYEDRITHL